MASVKLEYDPIGDILYLDIVPAYAGQQSREVSQGVLIRSNPETGVIESTEVQGFVARSRVGLLPVDIPLPGTTEHIMIDYEAASESLVTSCAVGSVPRSVRLDSLSDAYAAEVAELAARGFRVTA